MTNSLQTLKKAIQSCGYLPIDHVLSFSNHCYYSALEYIGCDFTTAPESSSHFCNAIASYFCNQFANCYDKNHLTNHLILTELGSGNGTLISHILNKFLCTFHQISSYSIYIIDISPTLILQQKQRLILACKSFIASYNLNMVIKDNIAQEAVDITITTKDQNLNPELDAREIKIQIRWLSEALHLDKIFLAFNQNLISDINADNPPIPDMNPENSFVTCIANEFFDALPVTQYVRHKDGGLDEVIVTLDCHEEICLSRIPKQLYLLEEQEEGIYEVSIASQTVIEILCLILQKYNGCAAIIDYGYYKKRPMTSTIQAISQHQFCTPFWQFLCKSDISHFVNFTELLAIVKKYTTLSSKIFKQGEFISAWESTSLEYTGEEQAISDLLISMNKNFFVLTIESLN